MNIGLVGYGRMGKEIERVSSEYDVNITHKFDFDNALTHNMLFGVDVLIDFSEPSAALKNMFYAIDNGIPIVVGVTGWYSHKQDVENRVKEKNGSLIFGSNFSIGMNIVFSVSRYLSKLTFKSGIYDTSIHEIHHTRKKDSPSGTALTLSDIVMSEFKYKKIKEIGAVNGEAIGSDVLHVSSQRLGSVVGEHTLSFDSESDTISLTHSAKNREGFARGAIIAAQWIKDNKGFYDFSDVFEEVLGV